MDARVLISYMQKCRLYGWNATVEGLNKFRQQIKDGLRVKPHYTWKGFSHQIELFNKEMRELNG